MKLAVIGAGVVGVATAYELLQDGHQVTVFESGSTAAEGASFANGGLLAPEWAGALASRAHTVGRAPDRRPWWLLFKSSDLSNARPDPGPAVHSACRYGAETLAELCERLQLSLDSHQGMMVLWRHSREDALAEALHARIRAWGGDCHLMPAAQARALELALNPETTVQGALVMPGAWSVNCRQFTLQLRARAQQEGCRFEFDTPIAGIEAGLGVRLRRQSTSGDAEHFDAVVLCSGADTPALLDGAGAPMPLQTWTGHSISASVREPLDAPVAVVHDLGHNISIVRMGQRVRVTTHPSAQHPSLTRTAAFKRLYSVLDDWFPGAIRHGHTGGVQEWTAEVVAAPDALPVIGPTWVPGIWVNAAHGNHGWVMACGSARLLADQLAKRSTAIDCSPYSAMRWAQ